MISAMNAEGQVATQTLSVLVIPHAVCWAIAQFDRYAKYSGDIFFRYHAYPALPTAFGGF